MHRSFLVTGVSVAVTLTACSDPDRTPVAPLTGISRPALVKSPKPLRGLHAEFYAIAQRVPGFAGFIMDPDNDAAVVLLSRSGAQSAVRPAIEAILAKRRAAHPGVENSHPTLTFKSVKHDFVELSTWLEQIESIVGDPAVRTWGLRESRNRIIVGVKQEADLERIRGRIMSLGVPSSAFSVEVASGAITTAALTDHFSSAFAGLRVTGRLGCTLGVNAYDPTGARFFVTASHCTEQVGAVDRTIFGQPNSAFRIGTETMDPAGPSCPSHWNLPANYKCRYTDAALVKYDASYPWVFGSIAATSTGNTFDGYVPIIAPWKNDPVLGERVTRTGASTGRRAGNIIALREQVKLLDPITGQELFMAIADAVMVDAPADGGDSGGPVYKHFGVMPSFGMRGYAGFMGIQFGKTTAGQYYFARWDDVEFELGGSLGINPVSVRIDGPRTVSDGPYVWQAHASGSTRKGEPFYSYKWQKRFSGGWFDVGGDSETYSETFFNIKPGTRITFYLRVTATGGTQYAQSATSAEYAVTVYK